MSEPAEPLPLDPTKLAVAKLTDPGRVRTENQDASAVISNVSNERLLVVADGMGGQRGGEAASKLCLDTLARVFRDPHGKPEERLRRGLELANEEVYSHALSNPELKGMGTTAVVLLFSPSDRGTWVAWVGDSRCYRLRGDSLEPITSDHSLMAEWIKMGVVSAEEAANHPRRNELTRAIGQSPDVSVEVARVDVKPRDRFLLSSDGIHGPLQERALKAALTGHTPDQAVHALIDRANAAGGPDNATAIVVEVPAEAFHEGAIEQLPEVPLELELPPAPAPAVTPAAAVEPPQQTEIFGMEIEPTSHTDAAAVDAALAELEAARIGPAPSPDDSAMSLPQMFEAAKPAAAAPPAAPPRKVTPPRAEPAPSFEDSTADLKFDLSPPTEDLSAPEPEPPPPPPLESVTAPEPAAPSFGETSFADLMDEAPAELTPPPPLAELERPAPAPPRKQTPPAARPAEPFTPPPAATESPSFGSMSPGREIQIPLMTPVRRRRGLHAGSMLTGLAAGALIAALGAGAWLYLGSSHSTAPATTTTAQRPVERPSPTPAPAPAPVARVTPPAPPAAVPAPVEPAPAPAPAPAPQVVAAVTPPPPAPEPAVPAPAPAPSTAPAPIAVPDSPRTAPTTVVIVRPPGPAPTAPQVPAAPDGAAVTPSVPTSAGFELAPAVRRFVDDWLRAQETHDAVLYQSLGFRELPAELAGTWTTRDSYRLVAASIDEERSTPDHIYLRVVVSYAFRDPTGRFRTEDEARMILRSQNGAPMKFEGRWQQ